MTDVDNQMGKLPHPFVNGEKMTKMNGQLVAIVGKVERVENSSFTIKTTDGKSSESQSNLHFAYRPVVAHLISSLLLNLQIRKLQ